STATFEYNYFLNTPAHTTENTGAPAGTATILQRYNLFNGLGWYGHPDGIQLNGGNFNGIVLSFNTFYIAAGSNTVAGSQPLHIEAQLTAAISNTTVAYNTVVTPGSCSGGRNWPNGCTNNFAIACKWDSGSNSNIGFSAYGNYFDWSAAIS